MAKIEVWIDGACEPVNPGGTASYGLVVKSNGTTIFTDSAIVGSGPEMSNNAAEYSGLLAFLKWYVQCANGREATVHSDSSLLINQMTGYWQARRGLYLPYYQRIWEIIHQMLSMPPRLCCFGPREGMMHPGECPVCHISRHIEHVGERNNFGPQLLYQRSYPGQPEYISPRCRQCFEKAEEKTNGRVAQDVFRDRKPKTRSIRCLPRQKAENRYKIGISRVLGPENW